MGVLTEDRIRKFQNEQGMRRIISSKSLEKWPRHPGSPDETARGLGQKVREKILEKVPFANKNTLLGHLLLIWRYRDKIKII